MTQKLGKKRNMLGCDNRLRIRRYYPHPGSLRFHPRLKIFDLGLAKEHDNLKSMKKKQV
jgi:hypothetical protein